MDLNTHSSDKIASNKGKSLRFELELTPISERTKEFSYAQLASGISEGNKEKPSIDPLAENEEAKLAKIAKKFEEKYGSSKRKRLIHESDLIDRGYGYDPSDSFVDDSELYEDYVPPQLDTKCGGFYINTGVLEFKTLEEEDNEEMNFVLKKKLMAKKHTTHAGNLAKHKATKLVLQKAQKNTPVGITSQQRTGSLPAIGKQASLNTKHLGEKKLSKKQLLFSAEPRETCISVGIGDIAVSVPLFKASTSPSSDGIVTSTPSVGQEQEGSKSPPLLPSNLPMEIQSKISSLEESITKEQQVGDGKLSSKTRAGYDDQFVDIELACKKITVKERTAVFEYLSSKVGISRQTILKRVKQILRKREGGALEQPLQQLKEAIADSMAEQLAQYEEEVKNRADLTTAVDKLEQEEDSKMDDMFEEAGSCVPLGIDGIKPKRLPRKRYRWTEDIKKLLCEVVRLKVESEEVVNRIRVSNGEELIMQFLEEKVRPLWPKGWMQKGILYRVSECAHRHFTSPQLKKSALTGGVKCIPPSTPPSTPLPVPLNTPLTVSTATSLSTSLTTPLTTQLAPILMTPTSTTPSSLSASLSNTIIKKALSTMGVDSAVTTPVSVVTTPLLSAVTTPAVRTMRLPNTKPHGPSGSLPGSVSKVGRGSSVTPPAQHGASLTHLQLPTSQQGSLLTSVSQQGSLLTSVSQQGSSLTSVSQQGSSLTSVSQQGLSLTSVFQQGSSLTSVSQQGSSLTSMSQQGSSLTSVSQHASPLTSASRQGSLHGSMHSPVTSGGCGKSTVGPSYASTQPPLLQTLKCSNKTASFVSPASRQSPTTGIPASLALHLQQVASMTARIQQNSNLKAASNSCVVSTGCLSTLSSDVSFSLCTALQGSSSSPVPLSLTASRSHVTVAHTASPSHMTVAHTASPSHMTVAHTASPSHMTVAHTASPSHMTVAHTASPSHMTVAHSTEVSLGSSQQRLLTLSRNSGNKLMTSIGGRDVLPQQPTATGTDRTSQPVNGQPASPLLKLNTMSQVISGGGTPDQ